MNLNKRKLQEIDASLTNQSPPHDFSRAPRSIEKHRKHWKASEYAAFLLITVADWFSTPSIYSPLCSIGMRYPHSTLT